MRKLTIQEIEKFASRSGVRKIAVENFLMSMGDSPMFARTNLTRDAGLYAWNAKTVMAIDDGITLAMKNQITDERFDELLEGTLKYAIRPLSTVLLTKITNGSIDMKQLAYEELENRRADSEAKNELKPSPLGELLEKQIVTVKNGTYMGVAADGKEVQLGNVGEEKKINEYLAKHPSPSTW